MSIHRIQTQIQIDAGAQRVWAILSDFAAYPQWNPFIRSIRGIAQQGARLKVRIQPNGKKDMTFRPLLLSVRAARELRWRGRFLLPGIFTGEHCFLIQPLTEDKILLQHSEHFSGFLVPLLRRSLDRDTKSGFEAMNRALKSRAEAGPKKIFF